MERKIGVIVLRAQPIHNGHLKLIEKAVAENDKVLLLVGSANKCDCINPIPIAYRINLINEAIATNGWSENVIIEPLNDLNENIQNNCEWGFYLYSTIVDIIKQSSFTMYYSDGFENVSNWFPKFITQRFVSFSLMARDNSVDGISATAIREMLLHGDYDTLQRYVPQCVYNMRERLRGFIEIFQYIK